MIGGLIALLRGSRTAQIVAGSLAVVFAFGVWLYFHDQDVVERHDAGLNEAAQERGAEAANAADAKQVEIEEQFHASQVEVGNASGVDDYLKRLRAQQDRERSAAARR